VGGVDEHVRTGDTGELLDPLAHLICKLSAYEREIRGHNRKRRASVVKDQRLGKQRVVDAIC
jgi:hypothetical protein